MKTVLLFLLLTTGWAHQGYKLQTHGLGRIRYECSNIEIEMSSVRVRVTTAEKDTFEILPGHFKIKSIVEENEMRPARMKIINKNSKNNIFFLSYLRPLIKEFTKAIREGRYDFLRKFLVFNRGTHGSVGLEMPSADFEAYFIPWSQNHTSGYAMFRVGNILLAMSPERLELRAYRGTQKIDLKVHTSLNPDVEEEFFSVLHIRPELDYIFAAMKEEVHYLVGHESRTECLEIYQSAYPCNCLRRYCPNRDQG